MFERRLKIFLLVLAAVTAVLLARAVQLQIVEASDWRKEAAKSLVRETYTEPTRGKLLDFKQRIIAQDVWCYDACVDYRAILTTPDKTWVQEEATRRVKAREGGHHDKSVSTKDLIASEVDQVNEDIQNMWARLAQVGGMPAEKMDDLRQSIIDDVETRRHAVWVSQDGLDPAATPAPVSTQPAIADSAKHWYSKWLPGSSDAPSVVSLDKIKIGEQIEPHVILRSINPEAYIALGKELEHFPGLVLRPGMERHYPLPYALAACHALGRLDRVNPADLENDPYRAVGDKLHEYETSDLIGCEGLEHLCEPLLRGTRGKIEQSFGDESGDQTVSATERVTPALPGQDVQTTLDAELQQNIRAAFDHVNVKRALTDPDIFADLHGAAVVIDVPTGEVRALVSAPGFDPNELDRTYAALNDDDLNAPLVNRATREPRETGSTIKPLVGIGAITQGVMGINDTINCDGYLWLNGHRMPAGRCWTMSEWGKPGHVIPISDPHPGPLAFPDALQRSCNVFFENMGDRLGYDGLAYWMRTFGLGRMTGIGIAEVYGAIPDSIPPNHVAERKRAALLAAIGQGPVAATPIQMANVAATIARNGIWMRPRLVTNDVSRELRALAAAAPHPSTQPSWMDLPDDGRDLRLNPQAVAAAQEGMFRVVNTLAGTGTELFQANLQISGKTGTAQASPFAIPVRDKFGRKAFEGSKAKNFYPEPSLPDKPNPLAPWYLGFPETTGALGNTVTTIELKHSWYIGYAPSHNPRIAFAVLVEYGGSGGVAAGTIARHIIDECIKRGYVPLDTEIRKLEL